MIQAVVPTYGDRGHLLGPCLNALEAHDIQPVIVNDSPSCGEGWTIGLARCTSDLVLLCSDDLELVDASGLPTACERARQGTVVAPVILNPDGSLQGAGGMGLDLADGQQAINAIAPLARRDVLEDLGPWPWLNHYCDTWISMRASVAGRGPTVTRGLVFTHHHLSGWDHAEYEAWQEWLAAA